MQTWGYSELHPGASGGTTGPEQFQQLTGAMHRNAGAYYGADRNARALGIGLGVTVPAEIPGVIVNDASHHSPLDGHYGAQNANMLDSRFAQNTAATSDHSLLANFAHFTRSFPFGLDAYDPTGHGPAQQHIPNPSGPSGAPGVYRLEANRRDRLAGEEGSTELLMLKDASDRTTHTTFNSLLMRDYTGSELGMLGLGAYAAFSLLAR